jgi:hypothetical protein
MDELVALVVKLPESHTDQVWTIPGGIVDERGFHERLLNINIHKIRYREPRGQMFRGRTTFGPAVLNFGDIKVKLNKKIGKVKTLGFIFQGVIPVEETEEGTVCRVDCYRPKGDDE